MSLPSSSALSNVITHLSCVACSLSPQEKCVQCSVLFWVGFKQKYTCYSESVREGKVTEMHLALGAEAGEVCDCAQFPGEFIPWPQAGLQEICLVHK